MFYASILLLTVMLAYHQITTRFDFYPFNGARFYSKKERDNEALINGIVMLIPIILVLTQNQIALWFAFGILCMVIIGAILSWWVPYATGYCIYKMPNNETWAQVYAKIFAKTIIILPKPKNPRKTAPNLEHMILHTLMIAATVCVLTLALR